MKNLIALLACILMLWSCSGPEDVCEYGNGYYKLKIDSRTGSIKTIEKDGVNLLGDTSPAEPVFNLRFRDQADSGRITEYSAFDAKKVKVKQRKDSFLISYSGFPDNGLKVSVRISVKDDSPLMGWNISVDNGMPNTLDHIDFPNITVKNDLIGAGGTGSIFWPGNEGCLIEDIGVRESTGFRYSPIEFPYMGCGGIYPTATQMQYMAYYNKDGGLYMAAHDSRCNPKGIEFFRTDGGDIKFDFRLFTAGASGRYEMPYDMVLGVFDGDWYDASAIYRSWRESSDMVMPPKIRNNKHLPEWYTSSPIVVSYPIRGKHDLGDMSPNKLYPYVNALKFIEDYNEKFDSRIMALLMHWEGTAPWAPPYVWPPYGGEKEYAKFVDALHSKGNIVGLYASGMGYTLRSNTDTTYNMYAEYDSLNLSRIMKVAPDGTLATNGTCAGEHAQRIGYDMCPANGFVKNVILDQITKITFSGTDYIQYFDQNHGGNCYMCYGTEHGHGYGPGRWQVEVMQDIYRDVAKILEKTPRKTLIGCESAAAEGFIPYLLFNDNRYNLNLNVGRPVPAYAFVYHEYVNNFMGNQVGTKWHIDQNKCPYNFLQRLAHSFCAGDIMTVVMNDSGKFLQSWIANWDEDFVEQDMTVNLIRNLNAWRKGVGKDFLVYGKMQKPMQVQGTRNVPMLTTTGKSIDFESVMTSNWQVDGKGGQIFVNYLPEEQEITIDVSGKDSLKLHRTCNDAYGENIDGKHVAVKIKPLDAVMVTYAL